MSAVCPVTVGVFDSGFGGLTVLRELLRLLPGVNFVYLGDTARLPYGSKSRATVARYAESSARFLVEQGASLLVVACNTATALALEEIEAAAAPVPVIGVVRPGAAAVRALLPNREAAHVLVLATAATVQSHAYLHALAEQGLRATEKPCPLLVPLVEEGWTDHPITEQVAAIYLREALAEAPDASALLLGCTHYPLLRALLGRVLGQLGRTLAIVDSAEATARAAAEALGGRGFEPQDPGGATRTLRCFATDSVEKFALLGSRFLGLPLPSVDLVDLGG